MISRWHNFSIWYFGVAIICLSTVQVLLVLSDEERGWRAFVRRINKKRPWGRSNNNIQQETEPKPIVVEEFMKKNETEILLERYEPLLRQSLHKDVTVSSGARRSLYRTSRSVRLPPIGDALVFEIERRASALAGFNHSNVEDFQLACYGVDELYGLHRDDDERGSANRAATVLIYLREPESGGATLFTRKEIEKEKDLDTKMPLKTEVGALKLFRQYCNNPDPRFVVVQPQQGTAVTWANWYGDGLNKYARKSTHGACPVVKGTKCVIQQWISRSEKHPLRDERVVAIFPAGADYSFGGYSTKSENCLLDASSQIGKNVQSLCTVTNNGGVFAFRQDGPYSAVGNLRVNEGLEGVLPFNLFNESGITVSFWVRKVSVGTTLFSIGNSISLVVRSDTNSGHTVLEVNRGDNSAVGFVVLDNADDHKNEWFWFSLFVGGVSSVLDILVLSRLGNQLGAATLPNFDTESCLISDAQNDPGNSALQFRLLWPYKQRNATETLAVPRVKEYPDSVQSESMSPEISFIIFHKGQLDNKERAELRYQIKRYDINT